MDPLNSLTSNSILADKIFEEIFSQEDEIYKARLILSLEDRANELGVKAKFIEMIKAYKRVEREIKRSERQRKNISIVENWTNFAGPYDRMQCGAWIASDSGIYMQNSNNGLMDVLACYHPIVPVERLKNLETGEEQIKLAYKRNNRWEEIIVPKTLITSANKIVSLSARGVAVTSENARFLVRYLSDVENANDEYIKVQYSTAKLGWVKNGFVPYDTDVIFDGDSRFKQLFDAIKEYGDRDVWYAHIRELRATNRLEIKFMLAAAFSSVLVGLLGGLPFFADLWGETEGGKTVTLMLATSVWANPAESKYMGDFKSTDVLLEVRADVLNHLPMILDDTSKTSARIRDNFEGFVYDLCSGKGKSRSNKDLGMNRENRWQNSILTSGERPLNSYVNQGGAINRILEVECGEKVYSDPQRTANLLKGNYGFAGRDFVKVINELGIERIKALQEDIQRKIFDDKKMQKQSISLSIILTADKLATDYLFKDGQYIDLEAAKNVLIDRTDLSDNERCYNFILDKVSMNRQRFDARGTCEQWGVIENGYAIIYNQAFEQICKEGSFSKKSFLSWAGKNELIQKQKESYTKVKKIHGTAARCVWIKISEGAEENGFINIEDTQEKIPFER